MLFRSNDTAYEMSLCDWSSDVCSSDLSRKTKTVWVIEKFTAHQLRHTYATMLFDANVDIKSAQMFLGHSDIEVTLNIYTHLSKFKTDEAIESLNGHLDKLSEMKYEC